MLCQEKSRGQNAKHEGNMNMYDLIQPLPVCASVWSDFEIFTHVADYFLQTFFSYYCVTK